MKSGWQRLYFTLL